MIAAALAVCWVAAPVLLALVVRWARADRAYNGACCYVVDRPDA